MNFDNQFKKDFLTQGNSWGRWYNMLMLNTPVESLSQIKELLKNNPELQIASCIVYIDKSTLLTLKNIINVLETEKISTFLSSEYLVYSTYMNIAITKAFMEAGCINEHENDLTINELNKYLDEFCTNPKTIINCPLRMLPPCFVFNDFAKKEELNIIAEDALPKDLQISINDFISRRNLHIKFWTTQARLSTYQTSSNDYLQPCHDFDNYDVSQNIVDNEELKNIDSI